MWIDSIDDQWVENNLETYINLAGPVLGVPKSLPAFLSGSLLRIKYPIDTLTCNVSWLYKFLVESCRIRYIKTGQLKLCIIQYSCSCHQQSQWLQMDRMLS